MNQRTNSLSKDGYMANCYKETVGDVEYIVKRPAKQSYTITPALTAVGQGLWEYNNNLYAVANGGLYSITGGTSSLIGSITSTTKNVSFINTRGTTPFMVLHDQTNGFVYQQSSSTYANIATMVGGLTITTAGTGATSGTWGTTGGGGSGATGTFTVAAGTIVSTTVTNHGSGYTSTPTIVALTGSLGTGVLTPYLNAFPSNPVPGLVYLDGYIFAMDSMGNIYQSDNENATVWNPLNFTSSNYEPDPGVGIAKHLNYLVAFKKWSTVFYYDAANATGSVLAVNQPATFEIGCATGDSIVELEQTVVWMGTTQEGGRVIARLDGLSPKIISTQAVEKFLNASSLSGVYSWGYKIEGHTFYGLVLTDQNITLVYDLSENEWAVWTTNKANIGGGENYFECAFVQAFPRSSSTYYVLDAVNSLVFTISPSYYVDPFGPVTVRIRTTRESFNTYKRKKCSRVTLFGDNISDTIQYRHTDDDYNTWSSYRTLDLSVNRPCIYQVGSFIRRAHELLYTGSNPLRLYKCEIDLETGQDE